MTKRAVKLVRKKRVLSRKKNVAAYARVSTSKDTMLHSLSAQVSYYSDLIQSTPGWLYAGVYVDEGITGTKALRPNFTRLINDARAGKIDLIITKSISRFARNTVVLLETVRELKSMNVEVFFEEQNLYSLSEEGELILTFLASYAQEEARSVSENLKWSIRNGFKKGKAWNTYVFGYEFKDGTFYVNKLEAEIVKEIYELYLSGKGTPAIAKHLNAKGIRTKLNNEWRHGGVAYVLRNYLYTGNMLLQSTFKDSFITKRKTKNNGELPKYHAENTHEAIIDLVTFNKVQEMIKNRKKSYKLRQKATKPTIYRGLLKCEHCDKNFRRKVTSNKAYWMCATYNMYGKDACPARQIPEDILNDIVRNTLGFETLSNELLKERVVNITLNNKQELIFNFKYEKQVVKTWKHKSRKYSWTPEMKERARRLAKEKANEKNNSNTIDN